MIIMYFSSFFFNDTATTEIYTLSLHDALPILRGYVARTGRPRVPAQRRPRDRARRDVQMDGSTARMMRTSAFGVRSEEHTSELQSRQYLVCRLLLEKKKNQNNNYCTYRYG